MRAVSRPLNAPADTSARDLGDVPGQNGIAGPTSTLPTSLSLIYHDLKVDTGPLYNIEHLTIQHTLLSLCRPIQTP